MVLNRTYSVSFTLPLEGEEGNVLYCFDAAGTACIKASPEIGPLEMRRVIHQRWLKGFLLLIMLTWMEATPAVLSMSPIQL